MVAKKRTRPKPGPFYSFTHYAFSVGRLVPASADRLVPALLSGIPITALSRFLLSGIPLATLSRLTARLSGILLTALTRTLPGLVLLSAALLLLLGFLSVLLVHHFLHSHHCRRHAVDTKVEVVRAHLPR